MPTPPLVPAAYAGFDRGNPPDMRDAQAIYKHSNLDFVGHYLSHNPEGLQRQWIPWKPALPKLLSQGWGIIFFYNARNQAPPALNLWKKSDSTDPKGLGKGAVVMVDNEDGETTFSEEVLDYYNALLEELEKPGDNPGDPPPVKAGLYARKTPAPQILERNPNVFLWLCENIAVRGTPFWQPPGKESLKSPIGKHPIQAAAFPKDKMALFMGRQWIFYQKGVTQINIGRAAYKINGLDFNASLVWDPRYPVAQPRIAVLGNIQLRTFFSKSDVSMHIEQVYGGKSWPSLLLPETADSDLLEPEAPLVLASELETNDDQGPDVAESHPELFTVGKKGNIVVITATGGHMHSKSWTWSRPKSIVQSSTSRVLRRNRALAAVKRSQTDTQLFFVSPNHILIGLRHLPDGTWTPPLLLADSTPVHWFSNIAAVSRGDVSVDIFFIDRDGHLHTAWWPATEATWPGDHHEALPENKPIDNRPILLSSTSIAAVSPSDDSILVFVIGANGQLYVSTFTANVGWKPLAEIVDPRAKDTHIFPHAQLSAIAVSPSIVYVATISEINEPWIYIMKQDGTEWKLSARLTMLNPAPPSPIKDDAAYSEGSAGYYTFNCFGDVVPRRQGNDIVLWMAGVTREGTIVGATGEKPPVFMPADPLGRTGGNRGLLFTKVKNAGSVWMLMK